MGELANYTIDQVAGALALTLGSVGGLCLILFKSRCQRISICWGAWACDRKVSEEEEEAVKDKPGALARDATHTTDEEAIIPPASVPTPTSSLGGQQSNPPQVPPPQVPPPQVPEIQVNP